jgi:PKD repeat protein
MLMVFMISRLLRPTGLACLLAVIALATGACEKVPLLAPSGSTITLTALATALPSNGTTDIIAQVIEAGGSPPHSGTRVTFSTNLGTVQPSDADTDISGRVSVKYVASAGSGTATIAAISGGVSASGTNSIKILIGTAAVGRVNVSASPALVPALGGTTTITAVVLDINGNPLSSAPVSFSTTAGTLGNASVNADQNGQAQTTLTTSATATVTASVGAQGSGGTTTPTTPTTPTAPTTPTPGATSGQASGTVTVGVASSPTLVITPPTTPPTSGLPATFTFVTTAATTNGSAVRDVTVNWGDGATQDLGALTGTASVSHVYRSAGTFTVTGNVTDAFGNVSAVSTSVTVNQTSLGLTITPPATAPSAGLPAAFTIAVTAPPAGDVIRNVHIDWGDGASQDLGAISGSTTVSHVYQNAGSFPVSATLTDTVGNSSTVGSSVTVVATAAPTIIITPSTPSAGHPATVTFTIQVTTPTGVGVQDAVINFGDGTVTDLGGLSGNVTVQHTYTAAGQYPVSLTVTDSLGRKTTGSTSVTIS